MKIFSAEQVREIDKYTIENEPVSSIDLMERASGAIYNWIISKFGREHSFVIFTGPGNNGGDGLAVARMLAFSNYKTLVCHVGSNETRSPDWEINMKRLEQIPGVTARYIRAADEFPVIESGTIIIDAIFGSGLNRQPEGLFSDIIRQINCIENKVVSIDIPSGLFIDDNTANNPDTIIRADYTLSLQFPKLSFLFPENYSFTGEWTIIPIGLSRDAIISTPSPYILAEASQVASFLKNRGRFDHKGRFGHGLLIAGSFGKIGASVLSAQAALRGGIGLLTCHVPGCGYQVIQTAVPEAMVIPDKSEAAISEVVDHKAYNAIGIGPGLGRSATTVKALKKVLEARLNMVIDADALNIIAENKEFYKLLRQGMILTPHPGEFERLAGKSENSFKRLMLQRKFSSEHNCIVVLKGAYTSVSLPGGEVYFNTTGNPGMATAGSGDVLTGLILSLLAQGYDPSSAAITGVFLHGLAGDIAAEDTGYEALTASDIVYNIGEAYKSLHQHNIL